MIQDAFVALDFETANGKRTSICSVGMVKVIDSQITETFHTLVNPQDYFHNKILKFMAYNQKMLKMHLRLTTYFHI
ncbi:DNA polymerase III polC-type [Staphylococcus aureus]|nr:DNA polymerase III polC-type [Staphylococcus aureus]